MDTGHAGVAPPPADADIFPRRHGVETVLPHPRSIIEADDIIAAIYRIEDRDDIEQIAEAVRERRHALRERGIRLLKRSLHEGSVVRFADNVKPQSLAGLAVTVVKVNRTRALVSVPDEPEYGSYRNHKMHCPLSLLEPV